MTMHTVYTDPDITAFKKILNNDKAIINTIKEVQIEVEKWKDEPYWYVDPAHIPITIDNTLKPNEFFIRRTKFQQEPKPKTRFEMIIEKIK